jgi:hypothetical protein
MLESHITWFNIKTVKSEHDVTPLNLTCQHKRLEEIYLAADGSVWPCCFLGFYPGQMQHPGNEQLLPLVHENNALEHSLDHCIKWFDSIEETWKHESIQSGRLYTCVNTCSNRTPTLWEKM